MSAINTDPSSEPPKRRVPMRMLFGLIWFFPIHWVTSFCIGAVVGFQAGFTAGSPAAGSAAGGAASLAFFASYGLLLILLEMIVTALLATLAVLPGTGKFKSLI